MFSKSKAAPSNKRATRPGAADSGNLSIIAADVRIRGDVVSDGELHLDGCIDGDVQCRAILQGETGRIIGAVQADSVVLRGHVEGSVVARTVTLERTARVVGDIVHDSISIEAGAHVDGRFTPRAAVMPALPGDSVADAGAAPPADTPPLRAIASN